MARRIFEPHFRCLAIEYDDYDCLRGGPIKAVAHPILVVLALAALACAAWDGSTVALYLAPVALFAFGVLLASFQRNKCADRVKAQISEKSAGAHSVHVVAHSFGTYLTAHAMESYDVEFHRVVLVGCVLPHRLNWGDLLAGQATHDEFHAAHIGETEIRNEVGKADIVVWFAGRTRWLSRALGCAGFSGFEANDSSIHTTEGPWDVCPKCKSGQLARVHNVPLKKYGHSKHFLGPGHALKIWLPFLWGYEPGEFRRWIKVCGHAAVHQHKKNGERLQVFVTHLKGTAWTWTRDPLGHSRTLDAHIRGVIDDQLKGRSRRALRADEVAEVVDEVIGVIVDVVQSACEAVYRQDATDDRIRWRLDPSLAIAYSVSDLLDERQ